MVKTLKILAIILLSIAVVILSLFLTFTVITKDARLDADKLVGVGQSVAIYDDDGNEIISTSLEAQKQSVYLENLQPHTVNAFIASEDRTFFNHHGLNYKRMFKALFKNIAARSFKQGASTISQQLIKNTHLSNDKTIKRKLNEIKLTRQLERKYSKNDILEMYLNTIYFGHNCYGLQSAAQFYFDKKAENLTLEESAVIVGLLTSPNNYSPFKNEEMCIKRRNIVLKCMLDCGYIDNSAYNDAISAPINAVKPHTKSGYSSYVNGIFDELEELDFDYYALADGCIIKTYLDAELQKSIENCDCEYDNATIITDNKTSGVKAFVSTIDNAKRQPGSTVKPIFIYAPAIEEKIISPCTKILDEKIDYSGYSPENYDKKYHGYVTVTESIKNSYNVPAVKTLNSLGINKCEKYLSAMNISLDDDEKNLSLALGGMKYGLTIKELCDRYSIFPNGGSYRESRFIKEIVTKDGKIIYRNDIVPNKVFSAGTCSLINDMLIETSKSGTARKLKNFSFDIASKTGTCGTSEGNTDAYTVSYTSDHCIAVWLGDKDNKRLNVTGGTHCCNIAKSILENLYSTCTPSGLDVSSGTKTLSIDKEEYTENNKIIVADPVCPILNKMNIKVLDNQTAEISDKFSHPTIPKPEISVNKNTITIELCQTKYYSFMVNRQQNGLKTTIFDGKGKNLITDTPSEGTYVYSVTPYYSDGKNKYFGEEIVLPAVNVSKSEDKKIDIPDIVYKDWYNQ